MKKAFLLVLAVAAFLFMACENSSSGSGSLGSSLYYRAKLKEQTGAYISANKLYQQAQPLLRSEGNLELGKECRQAVKRTGVIVKEYSATEQTIRDTLARTFPGIAESKINYLISRIDYLDMEGKRYYFNDFINTAYNLDLSLMEQLPELMATVRKLYADLEPFVSKPGPISGTPYINPTNYQGTVNYNVPRNQLPKTGVLKLWQPLPIFTDCQADASVVLVDPAQYVKNPPTMDGDLGDVYFEVPLEQLAGDLRLSLQFKYKHYEQRFTMIDPDNVGVYDKDSDLYKKYTATGKNIFISPEIAAKARELVAGEQNPYLAARKIYDYVVDDLDYSHMAHASLAHLNIPESVFVHNHRYGDCGAQGMYFSALLRSLGIPARATGGYQLFPGLEGTHFWAEFYLPNYGWVPVDTSAAQFYKFLPELSVAQKKAFKDYFFGSMDSYRWVIQKDVDLPFVPPAPEPAVSSMILQKPAVLCDEMDGIPEEVIWAYYSIQISPAP